MEDSRPSARVANWSREEIKWFAYKPGHRLVRAMRAYQWWRARGWWGKPMRYVSALRVHFWNVFCACDVPPVLQAGGGLIFPHPNGIIIHPNAQIGVNCMIFQQVTIGGREEKPGSPRIGGHVDIGAGAKILGGIVIGDHARIGANAVVLQDVPAGAVAVGVPARIIMPKQSEVIGVAKAVATALGDRGLKEMLSAAGDSAVLPVEGTLP
ncbi:MAG: serine acetyltransferase [Phycisphaerae bacterium]